MKKLVAILFTFFVSATIYALPVGNPSDASLLTEGIFWQRRDCPNPCSSWRDALSARIGFYGDYVFNRHLRQSNADKDVAETKIFTNAGYLALNYCDRVDLFTTLGATDLKLRTRFGFSANALGPTPFFIETDTRFSWSLGIRGSLWECGCLGIGAEAQYFRTQPDIKFTRNESFPAFYLDNAKLKYQEWQVGVGASYQVPINGCSSALVPYIAVKWSRAKANMENALISFAPNGSFPLPNLKNRREWGYALGLTLVGCHKASVTVEGRFADEKAVHVNSQFRF